MFSFYAAIAHGLCLLLCSGSYTSPLTHRRCSNTANFRAVAMMACLPVPSPTLGQLLTPAPPIAVRSKGSQNVVCPLHQQRSQIGIAFLADVHLRLALARVPPAWLQPEVAAYVPTFAKAMRIFQRQQESQRDQRAHTFHLLQQCHLRITFLRQLLDPFVALADAFTQRLDPRQQRFQCGL